MPRSTDARRRAQARSFAIGTALAGCLAGSAAAQVVFDDTFGNPGPAPIDPNGTITIEQSRGGTVSSGGRSHLLHSFSEFGIETDQLADFRTDNSIDTILARVTGPNASLIAGTLRVRNDLGSGGPDLFLLNPNGVLFGSDDIGKLDMDGAFYASTADFVGFADGARFSASDPSAPLPATASPPTLLGFRTAAAGDIVLTTDFESDDQDGAQSASSVTLVARNIRMGGATSGKLVASQATVQLAAVGSGSLDVPLDLSELETRQGGSADGSILIGGPDALFNVVAFGPGSDQGRIVIRAGELVMQDGALAAAGDRAQGADTIAIDVEVADRVRLEGSQANIESISPLGLEPGGVRIAAGRVEVVQGASIGITNTGPGDEPGRLAIEADATLVDGRFSEIFSLAVGDGRGGDITIEGDTLQVANQAQIVADSLPGSGVGQVGDITIDVADVVVESGGDILSVANAQGAGGDITLRGERLLLQDFARIAAGSNSDALGGDVEIRVSDVTLAQSSEIGTGPVPIAGDPEALVGPAGSLLLVADDLRLEGGSQITTTTDGAGDAGDLRLEIADTMIVTGRLNSNQTSGVFARSGLDPLSTASGAGGSLSIRAGRLEIRDGAEVGVQTFGSGDAGAVDIAVDGTLRLTNGTISGTSTGTGTTGVIRVSAGRDIRLEHGSAITSDVPLPSGAAPAPSNPERAGDIELSAGRDLQVVDSRIATDSIRNESGNIEIHGRESVAIVDSRVTTNIDSLSGQGGDIEIRTSALGVSSSSLTANAEGSNTDAGNVLLIAEEGIVRSPNSPITARASLGVSGRVSFNSPDTNLAGELGALASDYRDEREAIDDPCRARRSRAGSLGIEATAERPFSPEDPLSEEPNPEATDPLDGCATP